MCRISRRLARLMPRFSTITRSTRGITGVHGRPQIHELGGRTLRVYPLYHPSAALRSVTAVPSTTSRPSLPRSRPH